MAEMLKHITKSQINQVYITGLFSFSAAYLILYVFYCSDFPLRPPRGKNTENQKAFCLSVCLGLVFLVNILF